MALNLNNVFGTLPANTEFPGTMQALGDLIAQYMAIAGGEDFITLNFGPDTPDADDRDKPWFKTDADGNPLGWYSWNGSTWAQMPTTVLSGVTGSRPVSPANYTFYFDTTINVLLIYERAQWRTASGSPGDFKYVKASTLATALANNPGWSYDYATIGMVVGNAGSGNGYTPRAYGDVTGEEEVTLSIDQIPEHQHTVYGTNNSRWAANLNVSDPAGNLSGWGSNLTSSNPPTGEGGLSHDNMQPTLFRWGITKD